MSVPELRKMCEARGLETGGLKAALVERLEESEVFRGEDGQDGRENKEGGSVLVRHCQPADETSENGEGRSRLWVAVKRDGEEEEQGAEQIIERKDLVLERVLPNTGRGEEKGGEEEARGELGVGEREGGGRGGRGERGERGGIGSGMDRSIFRRLNSTKEERVLLENRHQEETMRVLQLIEEQVRRVRRRVLTSRSDDQWNRGVVVGLETVLGGSVREKGGGGGGGGGGRRAHSPTHKRSRLASIHVLYWEGNEI
jgi:hypothetical protein